MSRCSAKRRPLGGPTAGPGDVGGADPPPSTALVHFQDIAVPGITLKEHPERRGDRRRLA